MWKASPARALGALGFGGDGPWGGQLGSVAAGVWKSDSVVFAPVITMAARSPGAGRYAPVIRAALVTAAAGSVISRVLRHSACWAWRIALSSTRRTSLT